MDFTPENTDLITSFPKAQDSYMAAWNCLKEVDNSHLLAFLSRRIKECAEKGKFVLAVGRLEPNEAEKTGIQLERLGYSTSVTQDSGIVDDNGVSQPRCFLHVSWMHMPANKRDEYTI